jgi:hypothetical protein
MLSEHLKHGVDMKTYTVYRVYYLTNKTEPIGTVVDRRKRERNNNAAGTLRLAQKLFAKSSIDSHIYIVPSDAIHLGAYRASLAQ